MPRIVKPAMGASGVNYWSRTGTTLTPLVGGDNIHLYDNANLYLGTGLDYSIFSDGSNLSLAGNVSGIVNINMNDTSGIMTFNGSSSGGTFLSIDGAGNTRLQDGQNISNINFAPSGTVQIYEGNNSSLIELNGSSGILSLFGGVGLTFQDSNLTAPIPISESGVTGLVGYTATSIVGALNEALAGGKTYYTATVGASGADYTTIQSAITAHPTGTIFVQNGAYSGTVMLTNANNGLRIIGESRDGVVWSHTNSIITINTADTINDIAIENLTMNCSGGQAVIYTGSGNTNRWYISRVKSDGASGCSRFVYNGSGNHLNWVVENCELSNFTYACFTLHGTSVYDWTVTRNYMHDCPNFPGGVDTFGNCSWLNLSYNVIENCFSAIFTNGGGNTGHNISFNTIKNCIRGIDFFSSSTYCTANSNTIIGGGSTTNGLWANGVLGCIFNGNSITGVLGNAIDISGTTDTIVTANMNKGNVVDMFKSGDTGTISANNFAN